MPFELILTDVQEKIREDTTVQEKIREDTTPKEDLAI